MKVFVNLEFKESSSHLCAALDPCFFGLPSGHAGAKFKDQDQTGTPCIESSESSALDQQESHYPLLNGMKGTPMPATLQGCVRLQTLGMMN